MTIPELLEELHDHCPEHCGRCVFCAASRQIRALSSEKDLLIRSARTFLNDSSFESRINLLEIIESVDQQNRI